MNDIKLSKDHELAGKKCIITDRYPTWVHRDGTIEAADQKGTTVWATFSGNPSIYLLNRQDIEP